MSFGDLWTRTLVYFGVMDEDEEWDEDGYLTDEELQRSYASRPNVRRLTPRRGRNSEFDDWTDPEPPANVAPTVAIRPDPRSTRRPRPVEAVPTAMPSPSVRVHLVLPRSF